MHFIFLDHNTTGDGLISALQSLVADEAHGEALVRAGPSYDGGATSITQRECDEEAEPRHGPRTPTRDPRK